MVANNTQSSLERKCSKYIRWFAFWSNFSGASELYSVYRNRLGMSSVIIVSATYTRPLSKDWLYSSLAELIKNEPMLCTNVFDSDSSAPVHRVIEKVDLDKVVLYRPEIESIQQLNDELVPAVKLPYEDESMPLWRAYVIGKEQTELVWVYDHSIADGSSGVLFHKKLLACLNQDCAKLESNLVRCSSSPIAPRLEDVLDITPPWSFDFWSAIDKMKKRLVGRTKWAGSGPVVPMASQSLFFEIEPSLATELLEYCRNKQITVTALLYAALMKSIVTRFEESFGSSNYLLFTCPVNARRYIEDKSMDDTIGNYVFQYYQDFPLEDKDLSVDTHAETLNSKLKKAIKDSTDIRYSVGNFCRVDLKQSLQDSYNSGVRGDTAEISNLGAFEFEKGKVGISGLNFTQGVSTPGAYVTMNVVSVKGGTINGSVSVARDDLSKSKCTAVNHEMLRILSSLVK